MSRPRCHLCNGPGFRLFRSELVPFCKSHWSTLSTQERQRLYLLRDSVHVPLPGAPDAAELQALLDSLRARAPAPPPAAGGPIASAPAAPLTIGQVLVHATTGGVAEVTALDPEARAVTLRSRTHFIAPRPWEWAGKKIGRTYRVPYSAIRGGRWRPQRPEETESGIPQ